MTDVLFLIGTVVAFGVLVLLLRGCEMIVGSEPLTIDTVPVDPDQVDRPIETADPAARRSDVRSDPVSAGDVIGLVLSGLVLVYLLVVLIVPEKF